MVFEFKIDKKTNYALIHVSGELIEKGQASGLLENAEALVKENLINGPLILRI